VGPNWTYVETVSLEKREITMAILIDKFCRTIFADRLTGLAASILTLSITGILATSTQPAAAQGTLVNSVEIPVLPGLDVVLAPFARLPSNSDGDAASINSMAFQGQRLFVVESLDGQVWEITGGNVVKWFDVESALRNATGNGLDISNKFHGGLRSIAFHPEFARNGKIYTSQMLPRPRDITNLNYLSDSQVHVEADSVLSEWTVNRTGTVTTYRYREVFRVGMPVFDHPIKQITFNPYARPGTRDYGLLYIGHGDGSTGSETAGGGLNNDALGKIIRINPLKTRNADYLIPLSNPFIDDPSMLDAVYAIGFRNPHHLAFSQQGSLFVADAGRDNAEEVNLVTAGGNYGWPRREGTFIHLPEGGLVTGIAPLPVGDEANGYTYPAAQFGHTGEPRATTTHHAIAGGFVVSDGSSLNGQYFYGEFTKNGDIYHSSLGALRRAVTKGRPQDLSQARTYRARLLFDHDSKISTPFKIKKTMLDLINDGRSTNDPFERVDLRFGQGPTGELYLTSKSNNTIYRVINKNQDSLKILLQRHVRSFQIAISRIPRQNFKRENSESRLSSIASNMNRLIVLNRPVTNQRLLKVIQSTIHLIDGCGVEPDANDVVIDCTDQNRLRLRLRYMLLDVRQMSLILSRL